LIPVILERLRHRAMNTFSELSQSIIDILDKLHKIILGGKMIIPVEKIWEKFDNKFKAINIAALEARRLKDSQVKGLLDTNVNIVLESIRKLITGKIRHTE